MNIENNIEFLTNEQTATVTFSQRRFISKIKRLAENREECEIIEQPEANGGYLLAHIPVNWIRIQPPRAISDQERERMAETARNNFRID